MMAGSRLAPRQISARVDATLPRLLRAILRVPWLGKRLQHHLCRLVLDEDEYRQEVWQLIAHRPHWADAFCQELAREPEWHSAMLGVAAREIGSIEYLVRNMHPAWREQLILYGASRNSHPGPAGSVGAGSGPSRSYRR